MSHHPTPEQNEGHALWVQKRKDRCAELLKEWELKKLELKKAKKK